MNKVEEGGQQRSEPFDAANINMDGEDRTSYFGSCISTVIFVISAILIVCTFPFSLCVCIKMVQEYERAIIFRLGRVKRGRPGVSKVSRAVNFACRIHPAAQSNISEQQWVTGFHCVCEVL